MQKQNITTQEQARQFAIDWQANQANEALSWEEVSIWQEYFTTLGKAYDLLEEFQEEGII